MRIVKRTSDVDCYLARPTEHYMFHAIVRKPLHCYLIGDKAPVVFYPYNRTYFILDANRTWVTLDPEHVELMGKA